MKKNPVFSSLTYESPPALPTAKKIKHLSAEKKKNLQIRMDATLELHKEKEKRRLLHDTNLEEWQKYKEETKERVQHLNDLTHYGKTYQIKKQQI